jgi:flagellar protein FlaG
MDVSIKNQNPVFYSSSVKAESIDLNAQLTKSNNKPIQSSIDIADKESFELSISEQAVMRAVERANKVMAGKPNHAEFSVHKPYGDIVVKIVNSETQEIIREFPSEKVLALLDKLQELNGAIIDEKR